MTKNNYESRLTYLEYLLNLAFIDGSFSKTEREIRRYSTQAFKKIEQNDYLSIISKLESFHENVKNMKS